MNQKIFKCFNHYVSIKKIPNILNEKVLDSVIYEKVNIERFEKPEADIETFESIEELKYPQECNSG